MKITTLEKILVGGVIGIMLLGGFAYFTTMDKQKNCIEENAALHDNPIDLPEELMDISKDSTSPTIMGAYYRGDTLVIVHLMDDE